MIRISENAPHGPPRFSVIVLNWNGLHLLEECLSSVREQSFRDFELIVVDNGSTDGSVGWLTQRWAGTARLVALESNRGFAGGNNEGIRVARGEYIILLNNDTQVDPDWLSALSGAAERYPDAGMFTPKILNYYRRGEIDNTGHLIYPDGLARGRHRLERDDGRFDEEEEVLWPSGCAGMYKKDMLDEIGLLDEDFFAYGEDVDLGLRARWAGWKCLYIPTAVVYHKYSATTGMYAPLKVFLVERNRLWILLKNYPWRDILLAPFFSAFRYGMHLWGISIGRGASARFSKDFSLVKLAAITLKAEWAALCGIPAILSQRRRNRGLRRTGNREFRRLLRRHTMTAAEAAWKD